MVEYKITNEKALKIINAMSDKEVKAALLKKDENLWSLKFLRDHETAFRSLMPTYYDEYMEDYYGDNSPISYADRNTFLALFCLEHKIVSGDDFTSVLNFPTVGVEIDLLRYYAPSSVGIFKEGVVKQKDGDKKLLEFVKQHPQYLIYFLPLICSIDNDNFVNALSQYIKTAKLEDFIRMSTLKAMLQSSDAKMLSRCLDEIDNNNYYKLKAINDAISSIGDCTVILPPKELVAVLRDVADNNFEKYYSADFRHTYHFILSYKRVYKDKFGSFISNMLEKGGERARWALLNCLLIKEVTKYSRQIFSSKLTIEDLSFFLYSIVVERIDRETLPMVFEKLFDILMSMDKVNYHFKVDEDIVFARDVYKSGVIDRLARIASFLDNAEYIKRLDSIYDTLKEEAQAIYLSRIGDKTKLDIRQCATKFLKTDNYEAVKFYDSQKIVLTYDEAVLVADYLKSKKESVKTKIIQAFLLSKDSESIAQYLLSCKEDYKKSAGEEMLKSQDKVDNKKLAEDTARFSWHKESVFKVDKPSDEIDKLADQKVACKPLKPIEYKRVQEFFATLKDFIQSNSDYEYATDYDEGLAHFGSTFSTLKDKQIDDGFDAYPLGEQIKSLIKDNFNQDEIAGILMLVHCIKNGAKELYGALHGKIAAKKIYEYASGLCKGYWFNTNEFNIVKNLESSIAKELLDDNRKLSIVACFAQKSALDKYDKAEEKDCYPCMYSALLAESDNIDILKALTHFECILLRENVIKWFSYSLVQKAYERDLISYELAQHFILSNGFGGAFLPNSKGFVMYSGYKNKKYKALLIDSVEKALDAEFKRGSLQTPYSQILRYRMRYYGAEKFCRAIAALRGLTWVRSPYGTEKNEILSHILKNVVKSDDDSYEGFVELVKKYDITDDELMKATLFNPEFVDYVAKYLGIENLKIAVFWFIAHLNENLESDKQERRIEQIKEFSNISYPDFKDGAFDCNWYNYMIEKVPMDVIKRIYADAKYVTVGGLHKRAQRFFDAMNGLVEKAQCLEKIKTTRNKDYCLIYSLIPIKDREDLYERYATLAEFARGSKQFGAQRQMSERRTVDIALENLARAMGYASVSIFIFEMEAETPSDIYKTYNVENIAITPYIDENKFKIGYRVQKDGKTLPSIPSKYSKNAEVVALREEVKTLNQKFRRIISSFESAMNLRTPFTAEQLGNMSRERIIKFVLGKLILLTDDDRLCVFDGSLKDMDGNDIKGNKVYIAHPVQLKKLGLLSSAIEYIAKNNIRQPFKQALREIYTKTELELTQDEVLRFKGFEVDLKKCVSALKGRGWGVCEEIGLRKVYHDADLIAAIFRECDFWYIADYANVNRELHGIFFLNRRSGEIVPLKDVDDVIFAETLRDVDLVVSISSKVIYDFELAMSTVEIRHEVLKSIVRILGLANISFLKDNVKIQGKLGTYIVNIRTGLVFKEGKGNLALATIYSVDKPILLDFVDEDPMTADIISKVIVLANDTAIKDPSILREIKD